MNAPRPGFSQRLWYWTRIIWWGGTSKPGPAWLVAYGLAMGFIIGVLFHMNFAQIEVVERVTEKVREVRVYLFGEDKAPNLPRPVTPPPPGMAWVKVLTTAYCGCEICCPGTSDNKTAINRDIRQQPYGIAVEPKIIPYRISLLVPGYGYAMVDDTGGAVCVGSGATASRDSIPLALVGVVCFYGERPSRASRLAFIACFDHPAGRVGWSADHRAVGDLW